MREFSRLITERNAKSRDAIPLFFAHLDAGDEEGDGGIARDGLISLSEWLAGCLGSMAHYTDKEFVAVMDGMVSHLNESRIRDVSKRVGVIKSMKSAPTARA